MDDIWLKLLQLFKGFVILVTGDCGDSMLELPNCRVHIIRHFCGYFVFSEHCKCIIIQLLGSFNSYDQGPVIRERHVCCVMCPLLHCQICHQYLIVVICVGGLQMQRRCH